MAGRFAGGAVGSKYDGKVAGRGGSAANSSSVPHSVTQLRANLEQMTYDEQVVAIQPEIPINLSGAHQSPRASGTGAAPVQARVQTSGTNAPPGDEPETSLRQNVQFQDRTAAAGDESGANLACDDPENWDESDTDVTAEIERGELEFCEVYTADIALDLLLGFGLITESEARHGSVSEIELRIRGRASGENLQIEADMLGFGRHIDPDPINIPFAEVMSQLSVPTGNEIGESRWPISFVQHSDGIHIRLSLGRAFQAEYRIDRAIRAFLTDEWAATAAQPSAAWIDIPGFEGHIGPAPADYVPPEGGISVPLPIPGVLSNALGEGTGRLLLMTGSGDSISLTIVNEVEGQLHVLEAEVKPDELQQLFRFIPALWDLLERLGDFLLGLVPQSNGTLLARLADGLVEIVLSAVGLVVWILTGARDAAVETFRIIRDGITISIEAVQALVEFVPLPAIPDWVRKALGSLADAAGDLLAWAIDFVGDGLRLLLDLGLLLGHVCIVMPLQALFGAVMRLVGLLGGDGIEFGNVVDYFGLSRFPNLLVYPNGDRREDRERHDTVEVNLIPVLLNGNPTRVELVAADIATGEDEQGNNPGMRLRVDREPIEPDQHETDERPPLDNARPSATLLYEMGDVELEPEIARLLGFDRPIVNLDIYRENTELLLFLWPSNADADDTDYGKVIGVDVSGYARRFMDRVARAVSRRQGDNGESEESLAEQDPDRWFAVEDGVLQIHPFRSQQYWAGYDVIDLLMSVLRGDGAAAAVPSELHLGGIDVLLDRMAPRPSAQVVGGPQPEFEEPHVRTQREGAGTPAVVDETPPISGVHYGPGEIPESLAFVYEAFGTNEIRNLVVDVAGAEVTGEEEGSPSRYTARVRVSAQRYERNLWENLEISVDVTWLVGVMAPHLEGRVRIETVDGVAMLVVGGNPRGPDAAPRLNRRGRNRIEVHAGWRIDSLLDIIVNLDDVADDPDRALPDLISIERPGSMRLEGRRALAADFEALDGDASTPALRLLDDLREELQGAIAGTGLEELDIRAELTLDVSSLTPRQIINNEWSEVAMIAIRLGRGNQEDENQYYRCSLSLSARAMARLLARLSPYLRAIEALREAGANLDLLANVVEHHGEAFEQMADFDEEDAIRIAARELVNDMTTRERSDAIDLGEEFIEHCAETPDSMVCGDGERQSYHEIMYQAGELLNLPSDELDRLIDDIDHMEHRRAEDPGLERFLQRNQGYWEDVRHSVRWIRQLYDALGATTMDEALRDETIESLGAAEQQRVRQLIEEAQRLSDAHPGFGEWLRESGSLERLQNSGFMRDFADQSDEFFGIEREDGSMPAPPDWRQRSHLEIFELIENPAYTNQARLAMYNHLLVDADLPREFSAANYEQMWDTLPDVLRQLEGIEAGGPALQVGSGADAEGDTPSSAVGELTEEQWNALIVAQIEAPNGAAQIHEGTAALTVTLQGTEWQARVVQVEQENLEGDGFHVARVRVVVRVGTAGYEAARLTRTFHVVIEDDLTVRQVQGSFMPELADISDYYQANGVVDYYSWSSQGWTFTIATASPLLESDEDVRWFNAIVDAVGGGPEALYRSSDGSLNRLSRAGTIEIRLGVVTR